jgi:hypothetical protein
MARGRNQKDRRLAAGAHWYFQQMRNHVNEPGQLPFAAEPEPTPAPAEATPAEAAVKPLEAEVTPETSLSQLPPGDRE